MEIKGKSFGIIGMARSGLAAAKKIRQCGGVPFLSDNATQDSIPSAKEILQEYDCEFGGHSERLLQNDMLIVSPGVPLSIPIIQKAIRKKMSVISEIEFGYRIKHPDSRIIAVSGSNGKSTTVSLIHHILASSGRKSILAGNIGNPLSSYPIEKSGIEYIVLELSSFQLELIEQFHAEIAILLNITPDHMDRYDKFDTYRKAKFNIFMNQTDNDLAILNADDPSIKENMPEIKSRIRLFSLENKADCYMENNRLISGDSSYSIESTNLRGGHNFANMMAAILTAEELDVSQAAIQQAIESFKPLPHRLEYLDTIKGVKFYNDSKATNTESVKQALRAFEDSIRIIMGGAGKGEDYSALNPLLTDHAKKIYLYGESQDEMARSFPIEVARVKFASFESAIRKAFQDSEAGDCIVLSPAATSFDLFKNYEHRGEVFRQIVKELKDES